MNGVVRVAGRPRWKLRTPPVRLLLVCAGAALVVGLFLLVHRSQRARTPAAAFLEAAQDFRFSEARFSGHAWGPWQAKAAPLELRAAAGAAIAFARNDPSPSTQRTAALAALAIGDARRSVALFSPLCQASDAASCSDLAAARYTLAARTDDPQELELALAAADAALKVEPRFAEAAFNRALILQRLGLHDLARAAWRRAIATDAETRWADEGRAHLAKLGPPPSFRAELEKSYAATSARALVARFPQEARTWSETEILGRWGETFVVGGESAALHLAVARSLGAELQRRSGESLLADAVAAIDAAAAPRRTMLAEAHALYRTGRKLYGEGKPGEAEGRLRTAARSFAEGGSPIALVARYYTANTIYDQNRIAEAEQELTSIRAAAPARYRSLRAQLDWQLALCATAVARWGAGLSLLSGSASQFAILGEEENASTVRSIIADVYEGLGELTLARRERMRALARLGRTTNGRLQATLAGMSRTAIRAGDWRTAEALLGLEIESARLSRHQVLYPDALLRRALVHIRQSNTSAAADDLKVASTELARISDPALREREEADSRFVEGVLASINGDPAVVELVSGAIAFHRANGRRMFLPDMLLVRARAQRRGGRREQPLRCRTTPARAGIFDTANEVFDEAVEMQLERGDAAAALHYAERGSSRTLLEATGSTASDIPSRAAGWAARLEPGTVALSYVELRDVLYIFITDATGVHAVRAAAPSGVIRRTSREFADAVARDDVQSMHDSGRGLYQWLIAPVQGRLGSAAKLVISGEAELVAMPFSALRDSAGSRYLIEQYSVVMTPSLTAHFAFANVRHRTPRRLLAIGNPSRADGSARLAASEQEARSIARLYPSPAVLTGSGATREAFLGSAPGFDAIHFAGHGVSGGGSSEASLLLASDDPDGGRIYASELHAVRFPHLSVAVLAACGTAQGAHRASEGTWSIGRAFLVAGVPSVIATLWPLSDDDAPRFFVRLHRHLAQGVVPAEAVRATQLELINQSDRARPSLWAAVQIIGR
jgi:CHAT domain-containing protein